MRKRDRVRPVRLELGIGVAFVHPNQVEEVLMKYGKHIPVSPVSRDAVELPPVHFPAGVRRLMESPSSRTDF